MAVLAIANQKGGSAKTTTTLNLGAALARHGRRVLLIDLDPQGHLAEGLGLTAGAIDPELSRVLTKQAALPNIICPVRPRIDLAPTNLRLAYAEHEIYTMKRREDRLRIALEPVTAAYDDVLVDCPPSLGILTVNALSAADAVLIPMVAEFYSLLGVELLLQSITDVREEINPALTVAGLVPTRVGRTVNAREVVETTKERLAERLRILPPIPETVKFREAAALGKTIFEHAPDTAAAVAYHTLALEMERD
jgi:chromosome partitioning protein